MITPASAVDGGAGLGQLVDSELQNKEAPERAPETVSPLVWDLYINSLQSTALAAALAALALGRPRDDVVRLLERAANPEGPDAEARLVSLIMLAGGDVRARLRVVDGTVSDYALTVNARSLGSSSGDFGATDLLAFIVAGAETLERASRAKAEGAEKGFSRTDVQSVRSSDPQMEQRLRRLRPIATRGLGPSQSGWDGKRAAVQPNVTSVRGLLRASIGSSTLPNLGGRLKDVTAGTVPVLDPLTFATALVVLRGLGRDLDDVEEALGDPLEPRPRGLSRKEYEGSWRLYLKCLGRVLQWSR